MRIKKLIKITMLKLFRAYKKMDSIIDIALYKLGGRRPWSTGYFQYKWRFIEKAIGDKFLMKSFQLGEILPKGYGQGLDERVVEYPWVLSNLTDESIKMLDAGSALNFPEIMNSRLLTGKNVIITNLSPESNCFWGENISYVFADLRDLPFKNNYFDAVICISTLEHVGMDNSVIYLKNSNYRETNGYFFGALAELKRILKPGGILFVTVPFGRYENHRFFQQFNSQMLSDLIKTVKEPVVKVTFFQYLRESWQISSEERCKEMEYFDIREDKKISEDGAAAARAIACLMIKKKI